MTNQEVIETLQTDGDTISRQAAIGSAISGMTMTIGGEKWIRVSEVRESLYSVPSAQLTIGEWLRLSRFSEKDDNRYKCSHCGNVVRHKSRMDLYTFNSWCGRCGSDNRRHIKFEELKGEEDANDLHN